MNFKQTFIQLRKFFTLFVCELQSYHQSCYGYLVKKPLYVGLPVYIALMSVYIVIIVPTVVWLFFGIASGKFFMNSGHSVWELAWIVWEACNDYLKACGDYAACLTRTGNGLNYTIKFFDLFINGDLSGLKFHIIMSCFLSLTIMYQASLFMSLVNRKPRIKMLSYASFFFGLLVYMLALWILGLGTNLGPDFPVGFSLVWALVLFMMHVLWWLIKAYKCERLAFRIFCVCLSLGVIFLVPN